VEVKKVEITSPRAKDTIASFLLKTTPPDQLVAGTATNLSQPMRSIWAHGAIQSA
jgi:hypothetical protein